MQKEKWKWDWKFCEKGGGKKENAERKVEVRLKIQWERWKWKRKCGEKSESKNSERKVKPRGNLESHGWVETERGHSSVQRWVVDTFKIAADPTFFCLVSNKTQTFNIFTSLTSNIFLGRKRWPWRAEIGDIKLMRCGYNQYCLHCHFLEYWNTNSLSGKGTFTCQKEAKKMETSDNNTISIQNYGSSFWSGSCEPDLTNFKFIGGKKLLWNPCGKIHLVHLVNTTMSRMGSWRWTRQGYERLKATEVTRPFLASGLHISNLLSG